MKPHAIILVSGDFYCAHQPLKYLNPLLLDVDKTFRRVEQDGVRQSRTDWVLCPHALPYESSHLWSESSDHCAILCVLETPNEPPKATHIELPQADIIFGMCVAAKAQAHSLASCTLQKSAQETILKEDQNHIAPKAATAKHT
jgi:hypothetical protein